MTCLNLPKRPKGHSSKFRSCSLILSHTHIPRHATSTKTSSKRHLDFLQHTRQTNIFQGRPNRKPPKKLQMQNLKPTHPKMLPKTSPAHVCKGSPKKNKISRENLKTHPTTSPKQKPVETPPKRISTASQGISRHPHQLSHRPPKSIASRHTRSLNSSQ